MNNGHQDILTIRGVTKRFAVGDDEVEALAPVDLTIPRGEFVCMTPRERPRVSDILNAPGQQFLLLVESGRCLWWPRWPSRRTRCSPQWWA